MLTAIVGTNWGDEGKGRMVDLLSSQYDIVCRYQGGNNAGHTVVNEKGKFILNLLPSGILREDTVNILGPGVVIDLEHLYNEVNKIREGGIGIQAAGLSGRRPSGGQGLRQHPPGHLTGVRRQIHEEDPADRGSQASGEHETVSRRCAGVEEPHRGEGLRTRSGGRGRDDGVAAHLRAAL